MECHFPEEGSVFSGLHVDYLLDCKSCLLEFCNYHKLFKCCENWLVGCLMEKQVRNFGYLGVKCGPLFNMPHFKTHTHSMLHE